VVFDSRFVKYSQINLTNTLVIVDDKRSDAAHIEAYHYELRDMFTSMRSVIYILLYLFAPKY
jgi:type IV secretory pathway VirB9-like protein